jgi:hypothetical protein
MRFEKEKRMPLGLKLNYTLYIYEGEGYGCPEICSPEELLEVDK